MPEPTGYTSYMEGEFRAEFDVLTATLIQPRLLGYYTLEDFKHPANKLIFERMIDIGDNLDLTNLHESLDAKDIEVVTKDYVHRLVDNTMYYDPENVKRVSP